MALPPTWDLSRPGTGLARSAPASGRCHAGGLAAFIMTGTLYGTAKFHWAFGLFFGAALGALAALTAGFLCHRPTEEQMAAAVRASEEKEAQKAKPAIA